MLHNQILGCKHVGFFFIHCYINGQKDTRQERGTVQLLYKNFMMILHMVCKNLDLHIESNKNWYCLTIFPLLICKLASGSDEFEHKAHYI